MFHAKVTVRLDKLCFAVYTFLQKLRDTHNFYFQSFLFFLRMKEFESEILLLLILYLIMGYNISRIWSWLWNQIDVQNFWMNVWRKPYREHLLRRQYNHHVSHRLRQRSCTRLFIPRTRRRSLSIGNHHHSSRITFVNSPIFWHCGLRWFILW